MWTKIDLREDQGTVERLAQKNQLPVSYEMGQK
jgi:hypothetical protein